MQRMTRAAARRSPLPTSVACSRRRRKTVGRRELRASEASGGGAECGEETARVGFVGKNKETVAGETQP